MKEEERNGLEMRPAVMSLGFSLFLFHHGWGVEVACLWQGVDRAFFPGRQLSTFALSSASSQNSSEMLAFSEDGPLEIFEFDLSAQLEVRQSLRGLLCAELFGASGRQQGQSRRAGLATVSTTRSPTLNVLSNLCNLGTASTPDFINFFLHECL